MDPYDLGTGIKCQKPCLNGIRVLTVVDNSQVIPHYSTCWTTSCSPCAIRTVAELQRDSVCLKPGQLDHLGLGFSQDCIRLEHPVAL